MYVHVCVVGASVFVFKKYCFMCDTTGVRLSLEGSLINHYNAATLVRPQKTLGSRMSLFTFNRSSMTRTRMDRLFCIPGSQEVSLYKN